MVLFGQELEEFTTWGRVMTTVFRIMLGDYDWSAMIRIGRQQAAVWFWSFTWVVNLIMLNMLLAIVMDVYTEVKGHIASDAETMWSQVAEIVQRWHEIRAGKQIALQEILDHLERHHPAGEDAEKERLNTESFMRLAPGMPEHQATRLLVCTYENEQECRGCSMSETSSRVQLIVKNTQMLHIALERLFHMNEMLMELINSHFAEARHHVHHDRKARNGDTARKEASD
jgi:hypothetical protein